MKRIQLKKWKTSTRLTEFLNQNCSPFSYGEVHDQSAQGYELAGNIDGGECAIRFVVLS
jgi:hypothetical protein